jgi:hypothetical protein
MIEYKYKAAGMCCLTIIIIGLGIIIALPISSSIAGLIYNGTACDFTHDLDYCMQLGGTGLIYFVVNVLVMLLTVGPYLFICRLRLSTTTLPCCLRATFVMGFSILIIASGMGYLPTWGTLVCTDSFGADLAANNTWCDTCATDIFFSHTCFKAGLKMMTVWILINIGITIILGIWWSCYNKTQDSENQGPPVSSVEMMELGQDTSETPNSNKPQTFQLTPIFVAPLTYTNSTNMVPMYM